MLQYMAMGTQDPQREAIYNQLLCKGYELADKTYFLKEWNKAYGYLPTHSASSPKPLHTHSRNSISCWKQLNAHSTCRKSTKKKRREYTVIGCMSTPSMSCSTRYGSLHNGVKKTTRKHVNFCSHHPCCQRQSRNDKCRHPQPAPAF